MSETLWCQVQIAMPDGPHTCARRADKATGLCTRHREITGEAQRGGRGHSKQRMDDFTDGANWALSCIGGNQ